METERQITNIHEACQAFRDGFKWAGQTGGITHAHKYKYDSKIYSDDDRKGDNFWELFREISFMILGQEPARPDTPLDSTPEGKFECLTAEDFITASRCIQKVVGSGKKKGATTC